MANLLKKMSIFMLIMALFSFAGCERVIDENHMNLDLNLDKIYAIHNVATDLPLLHNMPGTNVTRLTHWWRLIQLQDNIYYLQNQNVAVNDFAPLWDRRIRLRKSSSNPDSYNLLPVSCFNSDPSLAPFIYVDYFDEFSIDNSECIPLSSVKNGWATKLERENISAKPAEILTRNNFEYKFTQLNVGIENRLKGSGQILKFVATKITDNDTILLPKLELREESVDNVVKLTYNCMLNRDILIDRTYFTFSIRSGSEIRVTIEANDKIRQDKFTDIKMKGWTGGNIKDEIQLKDTTWTLFRDMIIPENSENMNIIGISGLANQSEVVNSSNYLYFDKNRDDFEFNWRFSSHVGLDFEGKGDKLSLANCRIASSEGAVYWYEMFVLVSVLALVLVLLVSGMAMVLVHLARTKVSNNTNFEKMDVQKTEKKLLLLNAYIEDG